MLFLVDSGGARKRLQGMIKPKAWRGYLQEASPARPPASSTLRRRGGEKTCDVHFSAHARPPHARNHSPLSPPWLQGPPPIPPRCSKTRPGKKRSLLVQRQHDWGTFLQDTWLFSLMWGADGKQAFLGWQPWYSPSGAIGAPLEEETVWRDAAPPQQLFSVSLQFR